jgi:hypothetical protein
MRERVLLNSFFLRKKAMIERVIMFFGILQGVVCFSAEGGVPLPFERLKCHELGA